MTDSDTELATTLRADARGYGDVLDLAAALALSLLPGKREEEGWLGREDSEAKRAGLLGAIEKGMPARPNEVTAFLDADDLSPLDLVRRAYAVVDSVDHLVGSRAHPARPALTEPWKTLLRRLGDLGRYNPSALLGSIIPAPYNGGTPVRDAHHIGRRLRFTRPIRPYVLRYARISGLAEWTDRLVPVALLPVPHNSAAAAHRVVAGSAPPQYEIQHDYTADDLQDLQKAVREIEARRDIPVAIFPEAALDQAAMLDVVQEFQRVTGPGPGIQLLLVGHCGGKTGHNSFTVLKRGGLTAWTQAKFNSYDLKNDTIRRNHLALPLLSSEDECYREHLGTSLTPSVTVADTPYGRLMIAICEDVGHLRPSTDTAVEGRVTHLIAPLLNRELRQGAGEWYDDRVRSLSRETQCAGIVCTSAFLERHVRAETGGAVDAPVTVMLTHRSGWGASPTTQAWDPSGPLWVEDQCPSAASTVS